MAKTRRVGGNSKTSSPVKCRIMKPGQSVKTLNKPTRPKKSGILTLLSSPMRFFMRMVYNPYRAALARARASPRAIWFCDLWGNDPRLLSLSPDRSTVEIKTMPAIEASTPKSFLRVKFSTLTIGRAPRRRVQIPARFSLWS